MPKLHRGLLKKENGVWRLDTESGATEVQRLKYAYGILDPNNRHFKWTSYTEKDKDEATAYLKEKLSLGDPVDLSNLIQAVSERIGSLELVSAHPVKSPDSVHNLKMPTVSYISSTKTKFSGEKLKRWNIFIRQVNTKIKALNTTINSYNSEENLVNKKELLNQIIEKKKQIEVSSPTDLTSSGSDYEQIIHYDLFASIQQQLQKIDKLESTQSETEQTPKRTSSLNPLSQSSRSNLIYFLDNAPQDMIKKLVVCLADKNFNQQALEKLFKQGDSHYAVFQQFLSDNSITILSDGNSKNFKVESNTGETFVLKLENTLGNTKVVESRLRGTEFKSHLTASEGERQVIYQPINDNVKKTTTILITDFCSHGNILEGRKGLATDDEIIDSTLDLFVQMAEILLALQKKDAAFPDMKNTNWLIDKGRVVVADGKSFISSLKGNVSAKIIEVDNVGNGGIILSKHMIAHEFYSLPSGGSFEADKMHAFLFGKNLYQYMSNASDSVLRRGYFPASSIFNQGSGLELRKLIDKLTAVSKDRISMSETISKLKEIKQRRLGEEKNKLLKQVVELNKYQVSSDDSQIKQAIDGYNSRISSATDMQSLREINGKLVELNDRLSNYNSNLALFCKASVTFKSKIKSLTLDDRANKTSELILDANKEIAYDSLHEFTTYKIADNDDTFETWIDSCRKQISGAQTMDALKQITSEKAKMKNGCNKSFNFVKMKIALYRNGWYFKGNQKADLIEKELLKVPVEKRINFSTGEFPGLRNAMSAQRWSKNVFSKLSPAKKADETVEDKAPKIKP